MQRTKLDWAREEIRKAQLPQLKAFLGADGWYVRIEGIHSLGVVGPTSEQTKNDILALGKIANMTPQDYQRDVEALRAIDLMEGGAACAAGAISEEALMEGYAETARLLQRIRAFETENGLAPTPSYYDGSLRVVSGRA